MVFLAEVAKAVVESRRAALPKLNQIRKDAVSTPVIWAWDRGTLEFPVELIDELIQGGFLGNDLGLGRDIGAELAGPRSGTKVLFRETRIDFRRDAFDANLAFDDWPEEAQSDTVLVRDLVSFGRVVVGKEDKSAVVVFLEQYDSTGDRTVGFCCCQGHRIGFEPFGQVQRAQLIEPGAEERNGVIG